MFDLNGTTQYFTLPGSVVTLDSYSASVWLTPDFAPDSATVFNVLDVVGTRYRLYHSAANTWTMYADGRTKTFDVTAKWIAGQLLHVLVSYVKASDTLVLYLNGTAITPSAGSGTWGTTAVGATWRLGTSSVAADFFDGDVGASAIWNRLLTAAEIADLAKGVEPTRAAPSGLTFYAPLDYNARVVFPSSGVTLTAVASPPISQHPLILRDGPRAVVEGFQSVDGTYENPGWVMTGTETANTLIETVAAPAGTDRALGATVLRVRHLDTENALYIAKNFGASTKGWFRFCVNVATFPASTRRLLSINNGAGQEVIAVQYNTTGSVLYFYYHNGSALTLLGSGVVCGVGRWRQITIGWDTVGQSFSVLLGKDLYATVSTPLRSTPESLNLGNNANTIGTTDVYFAGIDIRTDRMPDPLYSGAYDLDGTADYLTAPQAVATAIQDEGCVSMMVRPDFETSGTTAMVLFRANLAASTYVRFGKSATTERVYADINGRTFHPIVTGAWVSGQWINVIGQWKKSTDTIQLYINGTEYTIAKSGTWASNATTGALGIGAEPGGTSKFNGAIGRVSISNSLLTAAEIALLAKGRSMRDVLASTNRMSILVGEWDGGTVTPAIGANVLTKVGAPAVIRAPGVQTAKGPVLLRTNFEGVGFEQAAPTLTGTETADTYADEDAVPPAGWPAFLGNQCMRLKQLATENALSWAWTLSAADVDTVYAREYLHFETLPGAAVILGGLYNATPLATVYLDVSNTGALRLAYHIAAGYQYIALATIQVGRTYPVEFAYSVTGQWVAYRMGGVGSYTRVSGVTLDYGGARTFRQSTSSVTTYSNQYCVGGIELRTDRWPTPLTTPGTAGSYKYVWPDSKRKQKQLGVSDSRRLALRR